MNHVEKRCAAEADLTLDFDAPSKADTARAFWDRRKMSVSVKSPNYPIGESDGRFPRPMSVRRTKSGRMPPDGERPTATLLSQA